MEDDQLQDGRVLPKSLCLLDRNGNSFKSGGSDLNISITKVGWEMSTLAGEATYIQL